MRVVSADEAVEAIASREQVFVHGGASTPTVLLDALVRRAKHLEEVGVIHFHTEGPAPHLAPEMAGHIRHRALFIGANAREAVNDGRADYVPVFLSDVPELFQTGVLPLDSVLLNLTPPDEHGFCSLGTSVDAALAAAHSARTVIAQLNPLVPRTLGDSFIHVSEIDMAVEVDQPPYEHVDPPIGDVERRIGENVAEIVPDRATLQMGIGSIPAAVGLALRDKRDLGAHTELFTDVVLDLVQSGALTGAAKEINRGKIVTAFLMGSRRLYDFVDDNPMVEMRPVDYTNDTSVIRRFRRMVAINSAISIDLTGQVSARLDWDALLLRCRGPDGLHAWCGAGPEGRAIIALPSTAAAGTVSRICAVLPEGAGVVTSRAHVRTVVTEYGIAELFGRSVRERAHALIAIAHPDFRDQLRHLAMRRFHLDA